MMTIVKSDVPGTAGFGHYGVELVKWPYLAPSGEAGRIGVVLGAIAGDVIGSRWEHGGIRSTDFELLHPDCRATDDSILTAATADVLLHGDDYDTTYRVWALRHPAAGYGGMFSQWAVDLDAGPYGSFGNGSAMRVSPVGWAFDSLEETLAEAQASAAVTHDHPEGIKGAQAVAAAIYLLRRGVSADATRGELTARFRYRLDRTVDEIRPGYEWNATCQGTVPEALVCALEADGFEEAVRLAISLGGDADTLAAIAGSVAEARFGGVPSPIADEVVRRLPADVEAVLRKFRQRWAG